MAISNRDLSSEQQARTIDRVVSPLATGVTTLLFVADNPCQVVAGAIKAFGLSGAPQYSFNILRAVNNGLTLIGLGATVTAVEGTTLPQGVSFTLGATQLMQTGDSLVVNSGVANTASNTLAVSVAVRPLQDIKTFFGASV